MMLDAVVITSWTALCMALAVIWPAAPSIMLADRTLNIMEMIRLLVHAHFAANDAFVELVELFCRIKF